MLARSRRTVLVLDGGAPRNAVTAHMHGVLGRDGWSPLALLETGRAEVAAYGGRVREGRAAALHPTPQGFAVTLDDGTEITARQVLVATGLHDALPDIDGLAARWGSGVAHCPYCDGWEARDSRVAVIGTGPGSTHQAQLLRQLTDRVTYYVHGSELPDDLRTELLARGIEVDDRTIASVDAVAAEPVDGPLTEPLVLTVRLDDGTSRDHDHVFVRPAAEPHDRLLRDAGAATHVGPDGGTWVTVDARGATSIAGLWAAGNVVDPAATVSVSLAAGSTAGAGMNAALVTHEVAAAISEYSAPLGA
jgi:thioredoxin reductase